MLTSPSTIREPDLARAVVAARSSLRQSWSERLTGIPRHDGSWSPVSSGSRESAARRHREGKIEARVLKVWCLLDLRSLTAARANTSRPVSCGSADVALAVQVKAGASKCAAHRTRSFEMIGCTVPTISQVRRPSLSATSAQTLCSRLCRFLTMACSATETTGACRPASAPRPADSSAIR